MKKTTKRSLGFTALAAYALAGCSGPATKTESTVTLSLVLNTPKGVAEESSSIYSFRKSAPAARWCINILCSGSGYSITKGESIRLSLPNGSVLYMLLSTPTKENFLSGLNPALIDLRHKDRRIRLFDCNRTPYEYDNTVLDNPNTRKEEIPYFVTLTNEKLFQTIKEVNPCDIENFLGEGYSLDGVYVKKGGTPTDSIRPHIPWLKNLPKITGNSKYINSTELTKKLSRISFTHAEF